jgi:antitoxin YefM
MIATDEVDGLIETAHLLRSDKNAQRLLAALSRARDKDIAPSTLNIFSRCSAARDMT